uniref:Phytochrome interaction factor 8 n=1 Tax=Fraxinus mandshurica TaxID=56029 RepID=A0A8T9JF33_9LAMI|nr:phytochrome interaction factor 8 [Fraxinus mandshurica]
MNQCVPSSEHDEIPTTPRLALPAPSNSNSLTTHVPSLDYEVAELTWENGQLIMHGLGPPRVPNKTTTNSSPTKYAWDKPRAGGTLESIVNQGTRLPESKSTMDGGGISGCELVKWIDNHCSLVNHAVGASVADFLVPCTNNIGRNDSQETPAKQVMESVPGIGTCVVGCSPGVGSCSGAGATTLRGSRMVRVGMNDSQKWQRPEQSMSGSATCGRESRQVTFDTCDKELGARFTSTASLGSPENTSSAKDCTKTAEDHDSVCHSISRTKAGDEEGKKKGHGKSSVSTKRSRAAAVHNQSERKRRDKINQRMKTLQKLVPNSSKADKASMLDEVIEYLKQLQAQVQIMSRMNMSPMMLPLAMQQQLQMPMMSPMGMAGMGMGFMDINTIGRAGMPPVLSPPPAAFMPVPSWDNPGDRLPPTSVMQVDPLSTFLACQSQPMTIDAYSRMATLYQQFQQQNGPGSKN